MRQVSTRIIACGPSASHTSLEMMLEWNKIIWKDAIAKETTQQFFIRGCHTISNFSLKKRKWKFLALPPLTGVRSLSPFPFVQNQQLTLQEHIYNQTIGTEEI